MSTIRIALCGRHTLVRTAFQAILQAHDDIEVVWSMASLSEACDLGATYSPDIFLLDFTDPTSEFLSQVERFRVVCPQAHLVALSDHGTDACRLFVGDCPASYAVLSTRNSTEVPPPYGTLFAPCQNQGWISRLPHPA